MTITVSEFQALGVSLLERVKRMHEEVSIIEAGVEVARLVPATPAVMGKPWHVLRGSAVISADLTQPIMNEEEVARGLQAEHHNLTSSHGD